MTAGRPRDSALKKRSKPTRLLGHPMSDGSARDQLRTVGAVWSDREYGDVMQDAIRRGRSQIEFAHGVAYAVVRGSAMSVASVEDAVIQIRTYRIGMGAEFSRVVRAALAS